MLIKPLLSEKSSEKLADGLYVFEVQMDSTKPAIAAVLKRDFKVEVKSIRIVNQKAKKVTFRKRRGLQASRKKAYVQLKPKYLIPGFELPKSPSTDSVAAEPVEKEEKK